MTGSITRRGPASWRLKYEASERDKATGKRSVRTATVHGSKKDAQRELTRLLAERDNGSSVDPSALTVAEHLRAWLDGPDKRLSPKTRERYRQLAEQQIVPHLGALPVQKLRPADVERWHARIEQSGGKDGHPLSPRTVGHAHRVLRRALAKATTSELVSRNVASAVSPPQVDEKEITILQSDEIAPLLSGLEGHPLHTTGVVALGTGMRRGEQLAIRWGDLDLDAATARIERSIEETADGLRAKGPKTRSGRRVITLPRTVVAVLREHRKAQLEQRFALGLGTLKPDDLVFATLDGSPLSPDNLSRDWRRTLRARNLPLVSLHALRHTHASALFAAGVDIVTISRRLGHASPKVTLQIYAHVFKPNDAVAADAIDAAMRR